MRDFHVVKYMKCEHISAQLPFLKWHLSRPAVCLRVIASILSDLVIRRVELSLAARVK